MTIKQGDFVQLSYTGKLSETGAIFDTTDKVVADKENIAQKNKEYGPVTICVGEAQILPGLDESVIGKKESDTYDVTIPPEKAFGKKDAKLVRLVPKQKFIQQKVNPVPNMSVYIDDKMGFIKTVSGGRVLVDFNHPFSGKTVEYKVIVDKLITDVAEKVKAVLTLGKFTDTTVDVKENDVKITFKNPIPDQMTKVIETHIKHLIKEVKNVSFTVPKEFEAQSNAKK